MLYVGLTVNLSQILIKGTKIGILCQAKPHKQHQSTLQRIILICNYQFFVEMQKVTIKQQQRTGKYETVSYSFTLKRGRFFLQGENLPTSGLLSKERPIKIDHPVQVSGMPALK